MASGRRERPDLARAGALHHVGKPREALDALGAVLVRGVVGDVVVVRHEIIIQSLVSASTVPILRDLELVLVLVLAEEEVTE